MAEEEFQESEVLFSDYINDHHFGDEDAGVHRDGRVPCDYNNHFKKNNRSCGTKKKKKQIVASSVPVNIPSYHGCGNIFYCGGGGAGEAYEDLEEDYDDDDGEIVPPHVILGRRLAGKMAFSVCTGNGRTLKGRDLSQVRNSILKMTGFLEA